jgi:hypothetical protein
MNYLSIKLALGINKPRSPISIKHYRQLVCSVELARGIGYFESL